MLHQDVADAALARHGGKIESGSAEFTTLDGSPDVAILSFPNKEAATAWASDAALKDVHDLRRSAG